MADTVATRGAYPEQFYPGTEELAADEMRITALGTGRPFLRRSQANASWLIELGNGDKFVFWKCKISSCVVLDYSAP